MFYPTWKYHAIAAAKRIDTQDELDALDHTEWKDTPADAVEALQLKNDPAEAERRALLKQEEDALAAQLAARMSARIEEQTRAAIVAGKAPVVEEEKINTDDLNAVIAAAIFDPNGSPKVETEEEELERLERETRPAESTPKL